MPGFEQFVKEIALALPGFDREWRDKVVQPSFAENRTVVFQRK